MLLKDTDLIKDWDWERNEKIGLYGNSIKIGSHHIAYWICENNHSYSASVCNRYRSFVNSGMKHNCPICSGRKVLKGYNDFLTLHPDIASEWDYETNCIKPNEVSSYSNKKVFWICKECGNKYSMAISHRSNGRGCPECGINKRKVSSIENRIKKKGSLSTIYPEIAKEWDYSKNLISPNDVTPHSNQKFYFICGVCGNSYSCRINHRADGKGCPKCGSKKAAQTRILNSIKEKGSLLSNYPEIAEDWDYSKNDTTPDKVLSHSNKKYYFICKICGNSYISTINNRVSEHSGCPECGKKIRLENRNKNKIENNISLEDYAPFICSEFDKEKNDKLPCDYLPFSNEKVYWKCPICGESYLSRIGHRVMYNVGCPKCNMSHGERIVLCFLNEKHIKYFSQYKFDDCVLVSQLPFDFYLPEYNIAIEYDGEQHYKPVDRFGGEEAFEELKKRDKIKDDYCKEHGIKLIRLTEKNPDKLFEILHNTIFAKKIR